MPKCLKCDEYFPRNMVINGKRHSITRRKYCLQCSPFGDHNTSKLHGKEPILTKGQDKVCETCSRVYIYDTRKGHGKTECNSCKMNKRRRSTKEHAIAYKGGACEKCGYNKCFRALHFHHRDPLQKEFSICQMMNMGWEKIKRELDKCDIVCSNCHAEEEYRLWRISSS